MQLAPPYLQLWAVSKPALASLTGDSQIRSGDSSIVLVVWRHGRRGSHPVPPVPLYTLSTVDINGLVDALRCVQ
ncbi:hypothetical protein AAFF_G00061550 [Aldrovandia affinis]|uniref:Uncharacterized protein n=1 Tax=Aldrovandia affinis TaxID=143900 RepID=A0AAD7WE50_9TELE|nr:hypothetical protein AAFF_G00061550 [Aldrovandia affinis]